MITLEKKSASILPLQSVTIPSKFEPQLNSVKSEYEGLQRTSSISKLDKRPKEEGEFVKRFNYNVSNKLQIQDLFGKLLKCGDAYQTQIKNALDTNENNVLSNFSAKLYNIQKDLK